MKTNQKGFTLIELLAVIIILAIIALIAVPTVMGIIDSSREEAAINAAYGYVDAIEKSALGAMLEGPSDYSLTAGTYTVSEDGKTLTNTSNETITPTFKGTAPTEGTVTIADNQVTTVTLTFNDIKVTGDVSSSTKLIVSD